MDPERVRRIGLGALILGAILLAWDVLYTIQAASGEIDPSQVPLYFATGAVVPGILLGTGLLLQFLGGRRARPARPGGPGG